MKTCANHVLRNRLELRALVSNREEADWVMRRNLAERDESYEASPCKPRVYVANIRRPGVGMVRIESRGIRLY